MKLVSILGLYMAIILGGCGGGSANSNTGTVKLSPRASVGEKIFNDASLSASGETSCAICHNASRAHAGADNRAVPLGGVTQTQPGFRNAPSLRYLKQNPAFFFDAEDTPTGGFNRDGRASSLSAQAARPLLAPHEMANTSAADVASKLRSATYANELRAVFGANVLDNPDTAFQATIDALAAYQFEDPEFNPFTSKYDFYLRGAAGLSVQELRGMQLFFDEEKGNCAACHPGKRNDDGSHPLFTDFTYDNIGVPRNAEIPATADANYFDLGLCGPDRTDLAARVDLCGAFKVPTLRNVAITAPYFHNGKFNTLKEAIRFYVRRDTHPHEWYPSGPGGVQKFDDLPVAYHGNVNTSEKPYDRKLGGVPALNDQEIDDVIAFLETLTDGYQP